MEPHPNALAISEDRIAASVERLRGEDLTKGELTSSLQAVVDATCDVFACDGAGVMLIDEGQALHYVGATDGRAAAFEAAQENTGEGPCVDSLILEEVVATADLGADERWPNLTGQVAGLGINAILGVPIRLGGTTIGSLNTYSLEPHRWDDSEVLAIRAHGRIVEEVLGLALLTQKQHVIVDQLTRALENRVTIERAIGVMMATKGLDPVRAFNVLRVQARSERKRVADVAAAVLAAPRFEPATERNGSRS